MPIISTTLDPGRVEWRRVTDPACKLFRVDFEYSLLGYDLPSGRLDMLLRYGKGGHCRRHRHVAMTVTLVLEGEQFLREMLPDGTTRLVHRNQGDYALAPADAHAHDEWGGDAGGTVLLSMTASDGVLFEYFDANMNNPWKLSLEAYVESWHNGGVYGPEPGMQANSIRAALVTCCGALWLYSDAFHGCEVHEQKDGAQHWVNSHCCVAVRKLPLGDPD